MAKAKKKKVGKSRVAKKATKPAKKKAAKVARPAARKTAARKVDPLNRRQYSALTPMLAVRDIRRAVDFYVNALGFKVRGIMDGPNGPTHAELRLRDTTLMLGPEEPKNNVRSAQSIGNTPVTLYLLVDDVDQVFGRAVSSGARVTMPVMDQFWGDRSGMIADPEGNRWMIATHTADYTEAEMMEAMKRMAGPQPSHDDSESEY